MGQALIPHEGETQFLTYVLATHTNWYVGLYKTAGPPAYADVLADYTADECDFSGYAALNFGSLGSVTFDGADNAEEPWGTYLFTADSGISGAQVISGWFLYDATHSTLLAAADLDTPVTVSADGDFVSIDLTGFLGNLDLP